MAAYATIEEAQEYFDTRLYTDVWDDASDTDKEKALEMATRTIDRLNFAGMKAAAWAVAQSTCDIDQINAAGASQANQFPRGSDTEVPDDIKIASYEEALALLDGKDPAQEFENQRVISEGYSSVRATYDRTRPLEHIVAGFGSPTAWKYVKPFLRDGYAVKTSRVS